MTEDSVVPDVMKLRRSSGPVFRNDPRADILREWMTMLIAGCANIRSVEVTLPDRPGGDWRDETGYGWIAKFWFHTLSDARAAKTEIDREGWAPGSLGRKIRVSVSDGRDGQRLVDFVLERWPDVRRIQLRCD